MNIVTDLTTVQQCIDTMLVCHTNDEYNERLKKVLTTLTDLLLFCQLYDKKNFNTVNRLLCKSICLVNDSSRLNEFAADVATIRYYSFAKKRRNIK